MAQQKQNLMDEIANGIRQVLEEVDRALNPEKRRKPAPVPVPVRSHPERPYLNPQEDGYR